MLCFCFLKHTDLVYFLPWIGLLFHLNWLTLFLLKLTFCTDLFSAVFMIWEVEVTRFYGVDGITIVKSD